MKTYVKERGHSFNQNDSKPADQRIKSQIYLNKESEVKRWVLKVFQ